MVGQQTSPSEAPTKIVERWRHYDALLACFGLHLILPLLPIGLELWEIGKVTEKSLTLAASMYSLSIGISSRSKALFSLTIIIGFAFAVAFGRLAGKATPLPYCGDMAMCAIALVFVLHGIERIIRHGIHRAPFFEFHSKE